MLSYVRNSKQCSRGSLRSQPQAARSSRMTSLALSLSSCACNSSVRDSWLSGGAGILSYKPLIAGSMTSSVSPLSSSRARLSRVCFLSSERRSTMLGASSRITSRSLHGLSLSSPRHAIYWRVARERPRTPNSANQRRVTHCRSR